MQQSNDTSDSTSSNETKEKTIGIASIIVAIILITQATVASFTEHKKLHFIHESAVAIILGVVVGLGAMTFLTDAQAAFDNGVFFYILLPIIIFKDGFTMNKHHFFKNFFYIMIYGILGTFVKFLVIVGLTMALNENQFITYYSLGSEKSQSTDAQNLQIYNIIFFAACISSKDSSMAISSLKFHNLPKVFSIIQGEQILNDIVVFSIQRTVQDLQSSKHTAITHDALKEPLTYLIFFGILLLQILVSSLVGLIIGLFATWLTKVCRGLVHDQAVQAAFTIYFGYLSFAICELFNYSGVISVMITGAILSHYIPYNFSKAGARSSKVTVQALAYVCEIGIYIYLGFCSTGLSKTSVWSYTMIIFEFLFIIPFARLFSMLFAHGFAVVFRIKTRSSWRINRFEFIIIYVSGIIRGPVAFALVQNQSKTNGIHLDDGKIVETTTISIIIMGTIIIGGALYYLMNWAFTCIEKDPVLTKNVPDMKKSFLVHKTLDEVVEVDLQEYKQYQSKAQTKFHRFDENYLKPCLIYQYKERKEDILFAKKELQKKEKHLELEEDRLIDHGARERRINGLPMKGSKLFRQTKKTFLDTIKSDKLTEMVDSKLSNDQEQNLLLEKQSVNKKEKVPSIRTQSVYN